MGDGRLRQAKKRSFLGPPHRRPVPPPCQTMVGDTCAFTFAHETLRTYISACGICACNICASTFAHVAFAHTLLRNFLSACANVTCAKVHAKCPCANVHAQT